MENKTVYSTFTALFYVVALLLLLLLDYSNGRILDWSLKSRFPVFASGLYTLHQMNNAQ